MGPDYINSLWLWGCNNRWFTDLSASLSSAISVNGRIKKVHRTYSFSLCLSLCAYLAVYLCVLCVGGCVCVGVHARVFCLCVIHTSYKPYLKDYHEKKISYNIHMLSLPQETCIICCIKHERPSSQTTLTIPNMCLAERYSTRSVYLSFWSRKTEYFQWLVPGITVHLLSVMDDNIATHNITSMHDWLALNLNFTGTTNLTLPLPVVFYFYSIDTCIYPLAPILFTTSYV